MAAPFLKSFPVYLLFLLLLSFCSSDKNKKLQEEMHQPPVPVTQNITAEAVIFKNDSTADSAVGGYGYNILINGNPKPHIHQPTIPAIPGNKGFNTIAEAEKVAALAARKIKDGNSLPTISIEELDSLGIK